MLLTVILLLSIVTVRGSACDDLKEGAVRNLQESIKHQHETGFAEVFPKNYVVQHHFNGSTQCEDSCCVFIGALFLYHSWTQLQQNLDIKHLRHRFITDLTIQLKKIWNKGFQEIPDPSVFPSVNDAPERLLIYTKDIFSKWLTLNCPFGEQTCILPSPAPQFTEDERAEKRQAEVERRIEHMHCGKEGERVKRCITMLPTSRKDGLFTSAVLILCTLLSMRIILDVVVRELF